MSHAIYDYEHSMLELEDVLKLIDKAIRDQKPLSLARFSHAELAYLGWPHFSNFTEAFETYSTHTGATASISTLKRDLAEALRTTDIAGFNTSWSDKWQDRETAKITSYVLQQLKIRPKYICSSWVTHELVKSKMFWDWLKPKKIILVGRRASEALPIFKKQGINVTYSTGLEGYSEIDKVYHELSKTQDWDIALISAGIPATILTPRLAQETKKVVVDFGHALDVLIDGNKFNYKKMVKKWKKVWEKKVYKQMFVSIVMSVYNGEKYLNEAVDSVLSQTYPNIELIVVNDGSTDATKDILDEINDKRVKVIHLDHNQGAANALNTGIAQAKGDWIAIQDADDISYPTRIEEQVNYIIKHPQLTGIGTLVECIPGSPDVSYKRVKRRERFSNSNVSRRAIRKVIFHGCPLTHSSVMFSKKVFWEVGGYNPKFNIAYDYDLWLRLLEKGDMEKVPKVLLQYRYKKNSLSHKDGYKTCYEVQLASSQAIYRFYYPKKRKPKFIVTGPKNACENYKRHIAPSSGLRIHSLIDHNWKKYVPRAVKRVKKGKIDGIIVLDRYRKKRILRYIKSKDLKLNQNVFSIYNIFK